MAGFQLPAHCVPGDGTTCPWGLPVSWDCCIAEAGKELGEIGHLLGDSCTSSPWRTLGPRPNNAVMQSLVQIGWGTSAPVQPFVLPNTHSPHWSSVQRLGCPRGSFCWDMGARADTQGCQINFLYLQGLSGDTGTPEVAIAPITCSPVHCKMW